MNIKVVINDVNRLTQMIAQLQSEIEDLNEQITTKNTIITQLTAQVQTLNTEITTLEAQITQLNSTIEAQAQTISTLQAQITDLDSQITTLNNQITSLNAQITSLNQQIASYDLQINQINGESVQDPLTYLATTKSLILSALQSKGSSATSSTTFRDYAQEVDKLGQAGDPHTLLLIHFGNETVKDSSMYNNTLSFSQSFTRSSTIKKFGSYSMATTQSSGTSGSWVLVSGVTPPVYEFTYEFWIYLTASSSSNYGRSVAGNYGGSQKELRIFTQISSTTGAYVISNAQSLSIPYNDVTPETWHHVAYCRSNTHYYSFLDGVVKSSSSISFPSPLQWYEPRICIGSEWTHINGYYPCYLDEFRISNVCRYTENFTPPTEPFSS